MKTESDFHGSAKRQFRRRRREGAEREEREIVLKIALKNRL